MFLDGGVGICRHSFSKKSVSNGSVAMPAKYAHRPRGPPIVGRGDVDGDQPRNRSAAAAGRVLTSPCGVVRDVCNWVWYGRGSPLFYYHDNLTCTRLFYFV